MSIKGLRITWVLLDAGLKFPCVEDFGNFSRKNHFVFYFFVSLKKRKWFLLGKEFIESFELLSPAFAKPFSVGCHLFKIEPIEKIE